MNKKRTNILVIGNKKWFDKNRTFFEKLQLKYGVEYINDSQKALNRLWHNSYDILIIEQKFCKENTLKLSKSAYARSKPSIILCSNIFVEMLYKIWKGFSNYTNICQTMKKLMFIYYGFSKKLEDFIDSLAQCNQIYEHNNTISIEINQMFGKN